MGMKTKSNNGKYYALCKVDTVEAYRPCQETGGPFIEPENSVWRVESAFDTSDGLICNIHLDNADTEKIRFISGRLKKAEWEPYVLPTKSKRRRLTTMERLVEDKRVDSIYSN